MSAERLDKVLNLVENIVGGAKADTDGGGTQVDTAVGSEENENNLSGDGCSQTGKRGTSPMDKVLKLLEHIVGGTGADTYVGGKQAGTAVGSGADTYVGGKQARTAVGSDENESNPSGLGCWQMGKGGTPAKEMSGQVSDSTRDQPKKHVESHVGVVVTGNVVPANDDPSDGGDRNKKNDDVVKCTENMENQARRHSGLPLAENENVVMKGNGGKASIDILNRSFTSLMEEEFGPLDTIPDHPDSPDSPPTHTPPRSPPTNTPPGSPPTDTPSPDTEQAGMGTRKRRADTPMPSPTPSIKNYCSMTTYDPVPPLPNITEGDDDDDDDDDDDEGMDKAAKVETNM